MQSKTYNNISINKKKILLLKKVRKCNFEYEKKQIKIFGRL